MAVVVSVASLLTMATTALADYKMVNGYSGRSNGQDYAYELWSNDQNTVYTLKVWLRDSYPNGYYQSFAFRSSQEALDYFECNYAGNSLPSCPKH